MTETKDKFSSRILAIAALIGALSPLVIKALDVMGRGEAEIKQADKEEIIDNHEVSEEGGKEEDSDGNEGRRPVLPLDARGFGVEAIAENQRVTETNSSNPAVTESNPNNPRATEAMMMKPTSYTLINEWFVLKEQRYLPFDDNNYRLYPSKIHMDTEKCDIYITDSQGKRILSKTLNVGESVPFEQNSNKYKIKLLKLRSRTLVSDLAYFNIYKAE